MSSPHGEREHSPEYALPYSPTPGSPPPRSPVSLVDSEEYTLPLSPTCDPEAADSATSHPPLTLSDPLSSALPVPLQGPGTKRALCFAKHDLTDIIHDQTAGPLISKTGPSSDEMVLQHQNEIFEMTKEEIYVKVEGLAKTWSFPLVFPAKTFGIYFDKMLTSDDQPKLTEFSHHYKTSKKRWFTLCYKGMKQRNHDIYAKNAHRLFLCFLRFGTVGELAPDLQTHYAAELNLKKDLQGNAISVDEVAADAKSKTIAGNKKCLACDFACSTSNAPDGQFLKVLVCADNQQMSCQLLLANDQMCQACKISWVCHIADQDNLAKLFFESVKWVYQNDKKAQLFENLNNIFNNHLKMVKIDDQQSLRRMEAMHNAFCLLVSMFPTYDDYPFEQTLSHFPSMQEHNDMKKKTKRFLKKSKQQETDQRELGGDSADRAAGGCASGFGAKGGRGEQV